MLELFGVKKSFGGKTIIESATISLAAGEILCLTGPSGIGKTTLLEIMAGIISPDSGTVRRAAAPALMFQDDVLIPWLTAEEAVRYILPAAMPAEEQKKRATSWLRAFGLESGTYPAAMSGGMRRRLSLARTFAAGRKLILLDEPFAFLDADLCRTVAETIADHAEAGCAIVLASHDTAPLEHPRLAGVPLRFVALDSSPVII